MAWVVLLVAGMLEAVWAPALAASNGLSRPPASALFAVALAGSMSGLAFAIRSIPVGTGYAIWVGIGAVGTVVYGVVARGEPATTMRIICLALIVSGLIGLTVMR